MANPTDIGPLDHRVSIVDKQGKPSPEFQRRWNSNRANTALITGTTFGSGAPTATPSGDGQKYFDTSTNPYRAYVSYGGVYAPASPIGGTPSALASDTATVGTATTFMRSDASPAIQKASSSQFGLVKVDGLTITSTGGIISSVGGGSLTISGPTSSAPPTIRGSSASLYSSAAPTVTWPTGTIVGDFVVIGIESAYSVTTPTGWTVLDNSGHGSTSFGLFTKVMTSADITAGGVTITCGGGYDGVWGCVSFQGATGGTRTFGTAFGGSPLLPTTSGSPIAGDYEIVFGFARATSSTITSSDGTLLQSKSAGGTDASGVVYGRTLAASGVVSPSVAFSAIDAYTSAGAYVVVVQGGPGVVSHSATEIDISGSGVNVSFVGSVASVSITGGGGGGGSGSSSLIQKHTCGTGETTFTFSGIPASFEDLELVVVGASTNNGSVNAVVTINGLTTGIYDEQRAYWNNTSGGSSSSDTSQAQTSWSLLPAPADTSVAPNGATAFRLRLFDYQNTTYYKQAESVGRQQQYSSAGGAYLMLAALQARTTAAITSITIAMPSGAFTAGTTFSLLGIGGSGGGGSSLANYYAGSNTSQSYSTTPTTDVVPDSCSITIPASSTARKFAVSFGILTDNSHPMHVNVALDGTPYYPTGGTRKLGPNENSDSSTWAYGAAGIVVSVPGDSASHTIAIQWNAQGSTSTLNYFDRYIVAQQIV